MFTCEIFTHNVNSFRCHILATFGSILIFIVRITAWLYVFHSCLVFISLLRSHFFLSFKFFTFLPYQVVGICCCRFVTDGVGTFAVAIVFIFRWLLMLAYAHVVYAHSAHFISKPNRKNGAASKSKWLCPSRLSHEDIAKI